jgi:AbrB family looped-hinge helix DNA binding protein
MVFMNTIVEIDKAGRIVVPKKLRDALHLVPGTRLTIERNGEKLTLMPSSMTAQLVIENGVPLIFPAGQSNPSVLTTEMVAELIEQGRLERERRLLSLGEDSAGDSNTALDEGAA